MWADLDNGYDAFSIDNSRTTLSDKPGQDTQLARALAVRLDYSGASAFDVVSRTAFGDLAQRLFLRRRLGQRRDWGANSPYDYFERFDRERRTLSEDLRLVSRAIGRSWREFRLAGGRLRAAHRRRRAAARRLARPAVRRRRLAARRATTAPPISPSTANSNGGSADATVLSRRRARRASHRRLPATPTARRFRRTRPCSAAR